MKLNRCVGKLWFAAGIVSSLAWGTAFGQRGTPTPTPAPEDSRVGEPSVVAKPTPTPTVPAGPPLSYGALLNSMKWREIGPATMGGRIDDFAVVESDPRIIYVGTAAGGIFKTVNGGTTWTAIFDQEAVPTIGDVTLAPSDPSVLYVGTGEANNRQSSSWGKGVYKSIDAGKTWQYVGLPETHHIGRIVVHPTNPDVAYVAAVGKLWGPSKERGVYKTVDGGKTWQQVLAINEDTGVTDIAMDTSSPNTLYAAAYQRRRTVFGFNGSGPGSALYKTSDGGATWTKLSKGLPYDVPEGGKAQPSTLETGRIAVDVYRKDPNVVYATFEHANGGVFRSLDKGETWTKMSDTQPRPMYFSQIRIDPTNDLRIWMAGVPLFFSEDGGKTFTNERAGSIHVDYHAIWVDPNNSEHALVGTDGGIHQTWDRGKSWDYLNNVAIGQFYELGVDMKTPYNICGGLQDNNTWCGPSATLNSRGIGNEDWHTVGGGDGFFAQVDPNDANIVYAESQDGNLLRRNLATGEAISIRPPAGEDEKPFRFNWNSPIVISAYDSKTLYYGGNFLFKSTDRGDSWTKISPELTGSQDRNTIAIMGKVPDKETRSRHDGVQQWPSITTVTESPVSANTLWVGTDDGQLHVTRDGGKAWKNVFEKLPNAPKGTYVSRIIASKAGEGAAFVTLDGHRLSDFKQYVYVTNNFGDSWKSLAGALPQDNGVISVIREHPRNPNLLFIGTEYGAYASFDRGATWLKLKSNLPTVPVDDIVIHPRENDLIFGTHGRSIWVLDDIAPLEQLNESVLASDLHLFDMRPAMMWRASNNTGSTGDKQFFGANPPNGALINFYFKGKPAENDRVAINISDAAGQMVRTINCALPRAAAARGPQGGGGGGGFFGGGRGPQCNLQQGFNRAVWDYRGNSLTPPGGENQAGGGGGPFGGGGLPGLRAEPGTYTVKISYNGKEMSKALVVQEDTRIQLTPEQRAARRDLLTKLRQVGAQAGLAQFTIAALRTNVNNEIESWKRPGGPRVPDNVKQAAEALLKKIDDAYPAWGTPPSEISTASQAGPPLVERAAPLPQRVLQLAFSIEGYAASVTPRQLEQATILTQKVTDAAAIVRKLAQEDLPALNKLMNEANVPHIIMPTPVGPPPGGNRPPAQ